jgi:hypothetical protein
VANTLLPAKLYYSYSQLCILILRNWLAQHHIPKEYLHCIGLSKPATEEPSVQPLPSQDTLQFDLIEQLEPASNLFSAPAISPNYPTQPWDKTGTSSVQVPLQTFSQPATVALKDCNFPSRNLLMVVLINPSRTIRKRSYSETEYELIPNSESERSLKRPRFDNEDIAIPEMQHPSIITSFDLLIVAIYNANFPVFSDSVGVFANTIGQDNCCDLLFCNLLMPVVVDDSPVSYTALLRSDQNPFLSPLSGLSVTGDVERVW